MTSEKNTAIVWFRQDLRLTDNPALCHALDNGFQIIPLYILDDENAGEWKMGGASRWFLYKSLQSLNESLRGHLVFRAGPAEDLIESIVEQSGAGAVFWNRCYEPWRIRRDKKIKKSLEDKGVETDSFNGSLLWEPWEVLKDDGEHYKVFTPFYRKGCLKTKEPDDPLPRPDRISYADFSPRYDESRLNLLPKIQWYRKFENYWEPGESGALKRLDTFLEDGLHGYKEKRNRPDLQHHVSSLSPHLHIGDISPRTIWAQARDKGLSEGWEKDTDHFCSELGWREFSYSLLYYSDDLPRTALQKKFNHFPWKDPDTQTLERWQKGQTGIPIVDAGMRQLWETGYMHNRVRMIVASLLVKNMRLHWHHGEDWFWDCLVDADLANNSASWQWVAGCGADAAPYFRIFNPETQAQKFDPDQGYIKRWVPEFGSDDYPDPVVDLKKSRQEALDAFEKIKGK